MDRDPDELMYRVFLIPTRQRPRAEEWLEAVTVRESRFELHWEFLDADGIVVGRFEKTRVTGFEEAVDRRRKAAYPGLLKPKDDIWDGRLSDAASRRSELS